MVILATFESQHGKRTSIGFEEKSDIEILARSGRADAFIVATEDGWSPLGASRDFLSKDLGIPGEEISRLANWSRFKNSRVSLVTLRSRRADSLLRDVILAASETSECYKRFTILRHSRPYRDFYYNVTYEAIAFACGN